MGPSVSAALPCHGVTTRISAGEAGGHRQQVAQRDGLLFRRVQIGVFGKERKDRRVDIPDPAAVKCYANQQRGAAVTGDDDAMQIGLGPGLETRVDPTDQRRVELSAAAAPAASDSVTADKARSLRFWKRVSLHRRSGAALPHHTSQTGSRSRNLPSWAFLYWGRVIAGLFSGSNAARE
jgi:hypothetical protein